MPRKPPKKTAAPRKPPGNFLPRKSRPDTASKTARAMPKVSSRPDTTPVETAAHKSVIHGAGFTVANERDFAERLVATAQVIVLVLDPLGRIVSINPYMEKLSGYRQDEVVGKDWFDTFLPKTEQARIRALFETALRGSRTIGNVNPIQTRDGRQRLIEWYDTELYDSQGNSLGLLAIGTDVTEKHQLRHDVEIHQENLARLYRIGTVNELAGGLAHELSQPLTAIQNYAGGSLKWLDSGGDPMAIRPALEAINTQSQRVVEIIQHLRRLITTGEPQRIPTDLNAVVTRARDLLKVPLARKNVNVLLTLAPDLPKATIDALQIEQVVIILMRNCIDAFIGEYLARPTIELHTAALNNDSVEVVVRDNGPGVTPDVLEHMFEPFYTTKAKGLGLGLMLARRIVHAHNGHIRAISESGGGLTVRVTLPINGGSR
jgi:PAS domain S-box-containing protein